MSDEKFSQGEWEVNEKSVSFNGLTWFGFQVISPEMRKRVCYSETDDEKNIPEMQANAALIAAAPEMYRELGMIEDFLRFLVPRCCPYGSRMAKDMWMRIDKIIELRKKARGEE